MLFLYVSYIYIYIHKGIPFKKRRAKNADMLEHKNVMQHHLDTCSKDSQHIHTSKKGVSFQQEELGTYAHTYTYIIYIYTLVIYNIYIYTYYYIVFICFFLGMLGRCSSGHLRSDVASFCEAQDFGECGTVGGYCTQSCGTHQKLEDFGFNYHYCIL